MEDGQHGRALHHYALMYDDQDKFLGGVSDFIRTGLEQQEPALIAIPGAKIEATRSALGDGADQVRFIDMNQLGRNPGRIIPAVREWVEQQDDRRCRFVGEPIWPGRTEREVAEATRHEALINLAFADSGATILCPYDEAGLAPEVLAHAEQTHPHLLQGDRSRASARYTDPLRIWSAREWWLPEPPADASWLPIVGDLGRVRRFAAEHAREAGLREPRILDLVLAVNEAATNALLHGDGPCELLAWREHGNVVCEVSDHGQIRDPLAGRRRPDPEWAGGRGVWLINQLCDLVELHSMPGATTIRLHMSLDNQAGR